MSRRSLHSILKPHLALCQACGLFPVSGVLGKDSSKLGIKWFGPLMVYSLVVWLFLVVSFVQSLYNAVKANKHSAVNTFYVNIFKYGGTPLLVTPTFWMISLKWSKFIQEWEKIEDRLEDIKVKLPLVSLTVVISMQLMMLAVLDGTKMYNLAMCLESGTVWQVVRLYYTRRIPLVFRHSLDPLAGCVVGFGYELVITLQWACAPALLSGVSLVLAARFRHLNARLDQCRRKMTRARQWRAVRETYSRLAQLTRLADDILNAAVMLTCFIEIYYVIIYVYLAVGYFWTTQSFVIICVGILAHSVTGGLCLLAIMEVYEETKRPLSILHSVPSDRYSQEVSRFYDQVNVDYLALTCGNFFHITRPLLLTILSTILTYELALTQFSVAGHIDTVSRRDLLQGPTTPLLCHIQH